MLEVRNVKVYDLKESVIASGNAMRLEPVKYTEEEFQKGLERMKRLVKASEGKVKCHKNALCGIRVSLDVIYPQYWTPEAQRYKFIDIVTSSSKMHRLLKMDLNKACNKYVDQQTIDLVQFKIDQYNEINNSEWEEGKILNFYQRNGNVIVADNKQDALYYAWMEVLSNTPLGLELFERISTNYLCLANLYWQRKNHKLKEDWGAFIKFIEELPYFKQLILGE